MRQGRKEQRERDWLGRILTNSKLERNSESPYLLEGPLNELMERERFFRAASPGEGQRVLPPSGQFHLPWVFKGPQSAPATGAFPNFSRSDPSDEGGNIGTYGSLPKRSPFSTGTGKHLVERAKGTSIPRL